MKLEFTGILADIYAFIFLVTTWAIILFGAYVVWSWFIFEVLFRYVFNYSKAYRYFIAYIWFRKDFKVWYDAFEAKTLAERESEQAAFREKVKSWFTDDKE